MEKYERLSEEETYWWIPFKFLDQTVKAILKCLGLLHHDPPTSKTESSPVTLNQPLQKEEEEDEEEEEEDVVMEDDVIITSRGSKTVAASRGKKMKAKTKKKERTSSGRPGKHHKYDL